MCEILFHGKRLDNGAWVEGFLVMKADPLLGIMNSYILTQEFDDNGILRSLMAWYKVDPETVGRYTGLPDKNGKKIFEGDILKAIAGNHVGEPIVAKVVPNLNDYELMLDIEHSFELEIIGNIHDNPELLEVGQSEKANM